MKRPAPIFLSRKLPKRNKEKRLKSRCVMLPCRNIALKRSQGFSQTSEAVREKFSVIAGKMICRMKMARSTRHNFKATHLNFFLSFMRISLAPRNQNIKIKKEI